MEGNLFRLEIKLDPLPLLKWLNAQTSSTRIYWASRGGDLEIAAVGLTDSIDSANTSSFKEAISTVQGRLHEAGPGFRYYGGHCFDADKLYRYEWHGFGQYRFILPQYEIVRDGDRYTLAGYFDADAPSAVEQCRRRLQEFKNYSISDSDMSRPAACRVAADCQIHRKDVPSREEWIGLVRRCIDRIQAGDIQKAVLAQKADLVCGRPVDPALLLEQVKSRSGQAYAFSYQFPGSGVFLGASPECLFTKDGSSIYSEAIAGTRPITRDSTTDLKFHNELLESAKETQEHQFVSENIQAALATFCRDVRCIEEHQVLQAGSVQHLSARFCGTMLPDKGMDHIFAALHPTAAVNGTPSQRAIGLIRSLEPFSRGWYAGAIGWMMAERADFAVGIRSALIQQNQTVSVYSGAGIVRDSQPEQEWDETELKKRLFLEALREIIC